MLDLEKYPALLTTAEVAEATGLSVRRIRTMIASGELPYRNAGRAILVPKSVMSEVFEPTLAGAKLARAATSDASS
ncbi:helix-turn-helix domain-containing protein [Actinomycetospora aeridis]|uniref:Helix-turn-helix domain-containing protein n=1 Tax=Actinomycetospora aeridis TaxID=3129231 RepID=A0ABU8N136_9PSEU